MREEILSETRPAEKALKKVRTAEGEWNCIVSGLHSRGIIGFLPMETLVRHGDEFVTLTAEYAGAMLPVRAVNVVNVVIAVNVVNAECVGVMRPVQQ